MGDLQASWAGHLPVVEALLDGGADPRLSNEGGVTAKAMAHKKGNHEVWIEPASLPEFLSAGSLVLTRAVAVVICRL